MFRFRFGSVHTIFTTSHYDVIIKLEQEVLDMDTYEQNDEVLLPEAQEEAVYEAPVVEESPAVEVPVVQEAAPRKKKFGKKFWKVTTIYRQLILC